MARKSSKQDIKDENTRVNKIAPLVSKLSSLAANDRSVALSAIMVLAEDPRMRSILLRERLVQTIMEQTLTDSNDEIVVELFGLLRNLVIEEGHDVAKHIWRLKIWAAMEAGLAKIRDLFQYMSSGDKKLERKRLLLLFDFTENVLSLMVAIAACSDELYENVYSHVEPVLTLVLELLEWNLPKLRASTKLFNALLDFLYEFASDSADFVALLVDLGFDFARIEYAFALDPALSKNNLARVYVEGLRFHILEVSGTGNKEQAALAILGTQLQVVTAIDLDNLHSLLYAQDTEPLQKEQKEQQKDIDMPLGESPEKQQARADLQAIDVTVDVLTTICEWLAINEARPGAPVTLEDATLDCLLQKALPACLHLLLYDRDHSGHLALTLKVLVAVNNLTWMLLLLDALPVGWYTAIPEVWAVVESVSQDNLEQQRVCLSILWGLAKSVGPEVRDRVSLADIQGLVQKTSAAEDFDFVLLAVGFCGTVAQLVGSTEMVSEVGRFLLAQAACLSQKEPTAIEVGLESLNLIYDIFGDAEYPYDQPVFVEGDYISKLQNLEPLVRQCYKGIDKNRSPELKVRAEEVWANLGRFIDYKKLER